MRFSIRIQQSREQYHFHPGGRSVPGSPLRQMQHFFIVPSVHAPPAGHANSLHKSNTRDNGHARTSESCGNGQLPAAARNKRTSPCCPPAASRALGACSRLRPPLPDRATDGPPDEGRGGTGKRVDILPISCDSKFPIGGIGHTESLHLSTRHS